tara:strand:+ start:849 stop:1253 length:405 start_codon:yes stop_codon:yes gene_type:complete
MIKLDWDNFSHKKMIHKVEEIKLFGFVKQITVYSSPSLNGYHCVILSFYPLVKRAIHQYRYDFEDDKNRLLLDMLSDNQKVRNVLFDYKIKTKFGKSMKFERKELFKYKRTTNLSEWQKIPKGSIKNYKQELLQ